MNEQKRTKQVNTRLTGDAVQPWPRERVVRSSRKLNSFINEPDYHL